MSDSLQPHGLPHARLPSPFTISWGLLKLMSTESVTPFNHLILCHLLFLPSIFPSIWVFSNESILHIRWLSNFSISPSNEYLGLISFRSDWFDVLAVQRTLKSLLQPYSLVSILVCKFYLHCQRQRVNF